MNDQSPLKTTVRFEDRSDYTFISERDWAALVHKLCHKLDIAMDKRDGKLEARERKRELARALNAQIKAAKAEGLAEARAKVEAKRKAVADYCAANPRTSVRTTCEMFTVSETFVREIRRELKLPFLGTGKHLKTRYAELAKHGIVSDEEAAKVLGATADYVRKLRHTLQRARKR